MQPAALTVDPAAEPPVAHARRLLRTIDRAALSTLSASARADQAGWPFGSFVLTALDVDLSPILLLSTLAQHSRNLAADDRCCLLFDDTVGQDEPMTGARVSAMGRVVAMGKDERLAARYLAHHPASAGFASFGDFSFYRVELSAIQLVAGFGRAHRITPAELRADPGAVTPPAWAASEAALIAQLNAEQSALIAACALRLGKPAGDWRLTGVDPEGVDLRCGGRVARLDFSTARLDITSIVDELFQCS